MVVTMDDTPETLTSDQAAELLKIHPGTLRNMRAVGRGPRFFRLSDTPKGAVRYLRADVDEWIANRMVEER